MVTIVAPLLVFVVGVLVYFVSGNGKVQEIGRAAMWVGLLWLVYLLSGRSVRF